MLEPYVQISDSDFNIFPCQQVTNNNISIPKEYIEFLPILQRYNFVKTPACHYEIFKTLLFNNFCSTSHSHEQIPANSEDEEKKKNLEIFNFFVSIMPKYPPTLYSRFSPNIVNLLEQIALKSLIKIVITNPSFFVHVPNALVESIIHLMMPKYQDNCNVVNENMKNVCSQINKENFEAFAPLVVSIFESNRFIDIKTPAIIGIIKKSIEYGPKSVFCAKFPSVSFPLAELTPISLMIENDAPANNEIYSALRACGFAYKLVEMFCSKFDDPKKQMTSVLMIHRFIKSGYAAVDAFIIAVDAFGEDFWTSLFASKVNNKYLASTAVICALSCFELPSLKLFVQKQIDNLIVMASEASKASQGVSKTIFDTFLHAMKSLNMSPMKCLFTSWTNGKETPYLPLLAYIESTDENDELFAPLIVESLDLIIGTDNAIFIADIARRLMLTGPTNAARYALNKLAMKCDIKKMLSNILSLPITLFVPAMHLIATNGGIIKIESQEFAKTLVEIIIRCVKSESHFSLFHIEYLSKFIHLLPSSIFSALVNEAATFEIRSFLRLMLMLTNSSEFAKLILRKPKDFEKIILTLRMSLEKVHDGNLIATIAILWRNMTVRFNENEFNQKTQVLFQYGARALTINANKGVMTDFIIGTFCNSLSNPVTIVKLVQIVKPILKDKNVFIAALQNTNEELTRKEFPSWDFKKGAKIDVIKLPDELWGHKGWARFLSSKVILIPE